MSLETTWSLIRANLGHFHPALVHFPVALITVGAALETWAWLRRRPVPSFTARVLLYLGLLAAAGAVASGLALFHPGDFRGRTLAVAGMHRYLGLATLAAVGLAAVLAAGRGGVAAIQGARLRAYRMGYLLAALLVGLTGHYGGWVVFGWGRIWTP